MALRKKKTLSSYAPACVRTSKDERIKEIEIWVIGTVHIKYRTNLVIQRQSILL